MNKLKKMGSILLMAFLWGGFVELILRHSPTSLFTIGGLFISAGLIAIFLILGVMTFFTILGFWD